MPTLAHLSQDGHRVINILLYCQCFVERWAKTHQEMKSLFPQVTHVPAHSFFRIRSFSPRLKMSEFTHTSLSSLARLLIGNDSVPPGVDKLLLGTAMLPQWPKPFQHLPYQKEGTGNHKIEMENQSLCIIYLGL